MAGSDETKNDGEAVTGGAGALYDSNRAVTRAMVRLEAAQGALDNGERQRRTALTAALS
jgi:ribosomal protein S12 methylthiotransferase accessory factor YcaO